MTIQKTYQAKRAVVISLFLTVLCLSCSNSSLQVANSFNGTSTTATNSSACPQTTAPPNTPVIPANPVMNSASAIMVGYGGRIMQTSNSGQTFAQNTTEIANGGDDKYLLRNVAHINNLYVATGYRIMTSTDGVSWTTTPSTFPTTPLANWLSGIAYGNGTWVLVGGCGLRYTSSNGTTWTEIPNDFININGCGHLRSVVFGNGFFFAVGDNALSGTSTDGVNWTLNTPTTCSINFSQILFANGLFYGVASGTTGVNVYSSSDAKTWALVPGLSANIASINYTSGKYIFTGFGVIYKSTDGMTWTKTTPSIGGLNQPIYSLSGGFLTWGYNFTAFSTDLTSWTVNSLSDDSPNAFSPL